MKKIFILIAVIVVTAGVFSCGNDDGGYIVVDSAKGKQTASASGKDLFTNNCARCHGEDGKAGVMGAKDLSQSVLDQAAMEIQVKNGKNMMPPFAGQLSDADITEVVKYAMTLRK